jgi:hypothetical protein
MLPAAIIAAVRRPYFFEIFAVANLVAVALLAADTVAIAGSPFRHLVSFALVLGVQAVAGVALRWVAARLRGDRGYARHVFRRAWWIDTGRLTLFGAMAIVTYGWIKLIVPIEHPRLFDQELWELDRLLFFGAYPVLFVLDLFGGPRFLRLMDWSYANVFYASSTIAFTWLLSAPSRRVRVAFANGNAVLWIAGAWLYLLIPSLGPAYRFPEIWFALSESLPRTQALQALLMRNYQNVLRAAAGEPVTAPIQIAFGIGAFPSLHVAFQTYVFFWTRRLWRAGEVLFAIFALVILLGSMMTGWHYLVDGLAGVLMAWLCYRIPWRRASLDRWIALREASSRRARSRI